MINIISYFTNEDTIIECLKNNLKNESVTKIHLYVDTIDSLNVILDLNINNKIKIISFENKIPDYHQIFDYINQYLYDNICMIMNSNTYLLENSLLSILKDNIFVISAHEVDLKCHVYGYPSYDALLFIPKYHKIEDFIESNKLYNPCFEIIIVKLNNIKYSLIPSPKIFVKQDYFLEENNKKYCIFRSCGRLGNAIFRYLASIIFCMKYGHQFILEEDYKYMDKEYIYYNGIDHIGNDIYRDYFNLNYFKQMSNNNDSIIAFNTLGFMKDHIDIKKLKTTEYINQNNNHGIYIKNILTINDYNFHKYIDMPTVKNYHLLMDGYFQLDDTYLEKRDEILRFIEKNKNNHYIKTATYNRILSDNHKKFLIKDMIDFNLDKNKIYDIVIHLRLGDFKEYEDYIDYIYIEKLLESIHFSVNKKICIVIQKPDNQEDQDFLNKCIDWFHRKNLDIFVESNDVITDFHIMKNAKILICGMSTLSWSAAYLSEKIELCYMPNYFFENRTTSFKKPIANTILYHVKTTRL